MRRLIGRFAWVFLPLAFVIGGCAEVTTSTTEPFTLFISSLEEPLGDPVVLEGAELCEKNTANCTMSGANGRAAIYLPTGEETSVTLEADGHASYLIPLLMRPVEEFRNPFNMRTHGHMKAQFDRVESPYPMRGTGMVSVLAYPLVEGATFELMDATNRAYYDDEEGNWSVDLTATTSRGWGGFVEITPGDAYQIRVGGTAEDCTVAYGWPQEDDASVTFPVREGFTTVVSFFCNPR